MTDSMTDLFIIQSYESRCPKSLVKTEAVFSTLQAAILHLNRLRTDYGMLLKAVTTITHKLLNEADGGMGDILAFVRRGPEARASPEMVTGEVHLLAGLDHHVQQDFWYPPEAGQP